MQIHKKAEKKKLAMKITITYHQVHSLTMQPCLHNKGKSQDKYNYPFLSTEQTFSIKKE